MDLRCQAQSGIVAAATLLRLPIHRTSPVANKALQMDFIRILEATRIAVATTGTVALIR